MRLNNFKLVLLSLLILSLGAVFLFKAKGAANRAATTPVPSPSQQKQSDKAQIISTKPDPLENTFILASQVIEITFNKPLQNSGEFKIRVEPKIEYRIELSQDRKTAKIIPVKPYELGISYTLTIGSDTKFDGIGDWGENQDFHFRTITYKGV